MKELLLIAALCLPMFSGFTDAEETKQVSALSEAEQLLIDSIEGVRSVAGQTIDFAKEQVPDVIQQLVVWNLTINFLLSFILFLASAFLAWVVYKCATEWDEGGGMAFGAAGFIATSIGTVIFFSQGLKIVIAPKVWLLEYAATLLKGH